MRKDCGVFIAVILAQIPFVAFPGLDVANIRESAEYKEALAKGAMAELSVQVKDETGTCVTGANICVEFDMTTHVVKANGITDACGNCVLSGMTRGNSICVTVLKEGHY